MTDMRKNWTPEQMEASEATYRRTKPIPNGSKAIFVPELNMEFDSRAEVARYFRVSETTIRRVIEGDGKFGDFTLEDRSV